MSISQLELIGALTGVRQTLNICAGLEIPRSKGTFWVDKLDAEESFKKGTNQQASTKNIMPRQKESGVFRSKVTDPSQLN